MPLGDPRLPADGKAVGASMDAEGEGVIDVVADESRGLIYAITCEHEYWMLFNVRQPDKGWRLLGPILNGQPNTLIDGRGRATAITKDDRIVRYEPETDAVMIDLLLVDGKPLHAQVRLGGFPSVFRHAPPGPRLLTGRFSACWRLIRVR